MAMDEMEEVVSVPLSVFRFVRAYLDAEDATSALADAGARAGLRARMDEAEKMVEEMLRARGNGLPAPAHGEPAAAETSH